ncbi:hypothetical protein ISF_07758 [Cordyceps fumosorosea ARSEF 2679]|uniref:Uncharacterized protein n=1 Tax=Cordyceps fumosorosea (strain ARSEF 2679) TaxID=1081104 RepID=A0A167NKK8_CORFA|nr:hypothetical protein ISF_07758 [Cordyceps fumosorosea ARSEF 2679]OAA55653.1 hypothetical protein ISF_07758 [Cordyceps fumosorosea ARSEF 2679]
MCGITGDAGLAVKNRATGEVYHPTATSQGNKNTDAGNADVAVDDASHEDLSALAAKLDTLGLEPAAAAAAAPAPADTAGPIPLRAIRASGPPLSDVQFCPGARIVSHTSTWYHIACMPESVAATLICTRCYQDLVAPTALAGDWTAILAAEESKVLWPQAVVAGDTYELRSETVGRIATSKAGHDDWQGFIEASFTRLQLPECTGEAVQSDSISWHIARGSLRSAPVCATCYQDHLATTPFAEHFRTYHPRLDNHLLRRGVGHDLYESRALLQGQVYLMLDKKTWAAYK